MKNKDIETKLREVGLDMIDIRMYLSDLGEAVVYRDKLCALKQSYVENVGEIPDGLDV